MNHSLIRIKILCLLIFFTFLPLNSKVYSASGTFSLSPAAGSFKVGDVFDVNVLLDTGGGGVGGSDIYLDYSKDIISLVSIDEGTIFSQYLGKNFDNATGKAALSGITDSTNLFTGSGTFANLRFKADKAGTANVTFKYNPGSTNDTNIVELSSRSDILAGVNNGSYTITTVGSSSSSTATPTPTLVGGSTTKGGLTETPTSQPTFPVTAGPTSSPLLVLISLVIIVVSLVVFRKSSKNF